MQRLPRTSGILAHPTSLPGRSGIGDIGAPAHDFVDFLARAGQRLWQVLPLNPTGFGNSPYASPSAFAGSPLLIALEPLVEQGWLDRGAIDGLRSLPEDHVAFDEVVPRKLDILRAAFQGFRQQARPGMREHFAAFRTAEANWLDDYALFAALHEHFQRSWMDWEAGLRDREPSALQQARRHFQESVDFHAFAQWLFFDQWDLLHRHAAERNVRIVGDIPIFVALDSADAWAHRHLFKIGPDGKPFVVAGVPPDYFSTTGQLWGNPLYDWEALRATSYGWWVQRFQQLLRVVDVVRIDHFRGFEAAWEVPANEKTAVGGTWVQGPGEDLFRTVERALGQVPIVAEDLGMITDDVRELLARLGYPGMKVLQFAFGSDPGHIYLPHMYESPNCVIYTGTHDNNTTRGWFEEASPEERDFARRYLQSDDEDITWNLIRATLASIADTAIVPLQDPLDLGARARMNMPGVGTGNWEWRVLPEQLTNTVAGRLHELSEIYGRLG